MFFYRKGSQVCKDKVRSCCETCHCPSYPQIHDSSGQSLTCLSLLMDESTDRGVVKCEGTLIRYYDESTLHIATVFFWGGGLQEVPEANASNLFDCLHFHVTQASLSYEKLIGWNSDGSSVMLGRHNCVVSRLKEKQPHLYMMHCICHVSHLIVTLFIAFLHVISLIENLYWWFLHSAKRVKSYIHFKNGLK